MSVKEYIKPQKYCICCCRSRHNKNRTPCGNEFQAPMAGLSWSFKRGCKNRGPVSQVLQEKSKLPYLFKDRKVLTRKRIHKIHIKRHLFSQTSQTASPVKCCMYGAVLIYIRLRKMGPCDNAGMAQ